ncbi:UNVERIFIED_CONTAM: ABC-type lipoprotein release transport system permease subunit [Acetivibrio alkalicellulosi]
MKISDIFSMSFKNLMRRKIRTLLTLIGVLIGTTSITVMMSIGVGMDKSVNEQLRSFGSLNTIQVYGSSFYFYSDDGENNEKQKLDDDAVLKFSQIKGVEAVSPELEAHLRITSGNYEAHVSMVGIDPSIMELFDYNIEKGRLLNENDDGAIVFGSNVPNYFYNPRDSGEMGYRMFMIDGEPPVDVLNDNLKMFYNSYHFGEEVGRERGYNVYGVGVLRQNWENDYRAYINIDYLKKIMKDNDRKQRQQAQSDEVFSPMGRSSNSQSDEYSKVLVKAKDLNDVERIQQVIKDMGYNAYSLAEMRNETNKIMMIIQAILGALGAISLLVAALGITNTMYMSIYERTKEIGVIKVLGCYLSDIRKIFLVEAALIGLIGGVIGMALSYIISSTINFAASYFMGSMDPGQEQIKISISIIPIWLVFFAIGFAILVGVVAGYFPSRRAMKISALEAIRNE